MAPRGPDAAGPLLLRPPGAVALVLLVVVLLGAVAVSPAGREQPWRLLLLGGPALALVAAWVLPSLRVDERGLVVTGVLRRHRVPWAAVRDLRQEWFLVVVPTDGARVVCLAVPVVGSMTAHRTWTVDEDNDMFLRDSVRSRPFPGAERSLALELVLARRPAPPPDGTEGVGTSTVWAGVVALVVGVSAVVLGLVLAR